MPIARETIVAVHPTSAQQKSPKVAIFSPTQPVKDERNENALPSTTNRTVMLTQPVGKTETIAITLTQAPPPQSSLIDNVSFIVGVVTFVGVVLSLLFAHRRMRFELDTANKRADLDRTQTAEEAVLNRKHDAELAHEERITAARRTAYLEVCEEVIKTQDFIGKLSMSDPHKLDPSVGTIGLVKAIAKMSIIGEMETVLLSKKLLDKLMVILFTTIPKTFPIQERVNSVEQKQQATDLAHAETKRILMGMKNVVENAPQDQESFQKLQQEFDAQLKISKQNSEQTAQLQNEINLMRKKMNEETMMEMVTLRSYVDELVHASRKELGLTSSLDQLREASKSSHELAQDVIAELHDLMVSPKA